MYNNIALELIYNSALLLSLAIIYEISYALFTKWKKIKPFLDGSLIGFTGLLIMALPYVISSGLVVDTRTVLISVAALVFGAVPAAIASVILIVYRVLLGGVGMAAGIGMVVVSFLIGMLSRKIILSCKERKRWLCVYTLGVVVSAAMLGSTLLMPSSMRVDVLSRVSLPVMLIYPVATVLLSMLMLHQKERNEYMAQMIEAQGRYQSLFDNNRAPMLLIQPEDGRIIDVNPAASEFYGWSIRQLKEMKISQIFLLGEGELIAEMRKALTGKCNYFKFRHKKESGDIADVEVFSGPITIDKKVHLYSIVHDISLRTASQKALVESETRFRQLVECAPDAIFIQTDLKFVFLNQAAVELFGAESDREMIGKPIMDFFHADYHREISARIRKISEEKVHVPLAEHVYLRMDGTPIDVEVTAMPVAYNGKDSAMIFARDISERKNMERIKTSTEAKRRQQQKLEAIGTLAGGVAHEINNPISGIMNYAELILDKLDEGCAEAEYAREIVHETERISGIVKNLLQFSRHEKQAHSYASVYDIVNQTISLINTVIRKDRIQLHIDVEEGLPEIKCRSQQIQQVLMNLLTNARDALNEKYPEYHEDKAIWLSCRLFLGKGRKWIRLIVEDHGKGIPAGIQEKIFEPFFSTKPKEKGTGLGLSISFGIIKDHHGKIFVETQEGKFTRFILELPVDNGWKLER